MNIVHEVLHDSAEIYKTNKDIYSSEDNRKAVAEMVEKDLNAKGLSVSYAVKKNIVNNVAQHACNYKEVGLIVSLIGKGFLKGCNDKYKMDINIPGFLKLSQKYPNASITKLIASLVVKHKTNDSVLAEKIFDKNDSLLIGFSSVADLVRNSKKNNNVKANQSGVIRAMQNSLEIDFLKPQNIYDDTNTFDIKLALKKDKKRKELFLEKRKKLQERLKHLEIASRVEIKSVTKDDLVKAKLKEIYNVSA